VESGKDKLIPWRQEVAAAAHSKMRDGPWKVPVQVSCTFFFPRPKAHFGTGRNAETLRPSAPKRPAGKPDIDKLVRAVLDAMTGIVFSDDSQVVALDAMKLYADMETPGVTVDCRALVPDFEF